MTGTVTVYFNTGFNGIDIPSSPSVLAAASQQVYSDVYYMREDIDKPTIRIKDSYENLCAVDYCAITTNGTTKYFFASPSALTKGVTMLALDLDALLTMGGAENITYISGWQERGHIKKTDDTLFGNIASEEWIPTQPLENVNVSEVKASGTQAAADLKLIVSNIDIKSIGQMPGVQEVVEGKVNTTDPNAVMYWPKLKTPQSATAFTIWDFDNTSAGYAGDSFSLPQTKVYSQVDPVTGNSVTDVIAGIEQLFSAGQLQLQGSYVLPKEYIDSWTYTSGSGEFSVITGVHESKNLSSMPFEYTVSGYTVKNKKCFATYRQFGVAAVGSGDMCIKDVEHLYRSGLTYPVLDIWADPCSTGKPYARFSYIKGAPYHYIDCVKGLQWATAQLVLEGASGSFWNSIDNAFANQQLQRQQSMNTFNAGVAAQGYDLQMQQANMGLKYAGINAGLGVMQAAGGGIGKGASGATSAGFSAARSMSALSQSVEQNTFQLQSLWNEMNANSSRAEMENNNLQNRINQNNIGLIRSNNIVAPTVMFTPEQNLGLYGHNYFVAFEIRKTDEDLKSEDMYYQRYGYNGLHRPLTQQCFKERQYYNYVQAFDINLKGATEFGLRVRTKAISQLNKGVRVWRVLPDASYYDTN